MVSHYELLGLKQNATLEEIKAAYRKQCLESHPDRNSGEVEQFKAVQVAFEVLVEEKTPTPPNDSQPEAVMRKSMADIGNLV